MLPLLALLTAFPALATDMYLPALPTLANQWQTPMSMINLTLFGFFSVYGLFLLVYGPLSDRYGRRPVLIIGLSIFVVGSILCAFAFGAISLIVFRVIQAIGAASASALSLAICKDIYDGKERVRVLAHIAVIMTLAPMLGPIIGGVIITYMSWQVVFWSQTVLGLIALLGVLRSPETLPEASDISLGIVFKNYFQLLTNVRFTIYTLLMSGAGFTFFAFIGGSSDFYISRFGLSENAFGYFFAINAVASMLGAALCDKLTKWISSRQIITIGYGGLLVGGLAIYLYGNLGPWPLTICMFLVSFALGLSRPPSNNIVLEQIHRNAGAASSLLIFANMMTGAVGMEVIALNWTDKIKVLGLSGIIFGAVTLVVWLISQRVLEHRGPKRPSLTTMSLTKKQMLPLLALLTAFPALATDMYLPALPTLAQQWHQPMSVINLTLFGFFVVYGLCLLVYGPVSDRYGRRPALITGLIIFLMGSIFCAFAFSAVSLIVFRVIQAIGAASASALSLAMCKDLYDGKERIRVLAHIAVIIAIAPMLGPIIGGIIMTYMSWPVAFWLQAALGAIALLGVLKAPETLSEPSDIGLRIVFKNYFWLLTNIRFMAYALLMSLLGFPLFAFIGGSSDLYITIFGLSEKAYGYFFALNAIAMMLGSFACERLIRLVASRHLITVGYAGGFIGFLAVYFYGNQSPLHLTLCIALASFSMGLSRPPSNNIALEQIHRNAGAASSLLVFSNMMIGACGMEFIALSWNDKIQVLGLSGIICGGAALVFWLIMLRIFESRKRGVLYSVDDDQSSNIQSLSVKQETTIPSEQP
jgi:DHA1 family bicyclomycin/chloramphenicol resistance-like MFS transporter